MHQLPQTLERLTKKIPDQSGAPIDPRSWLEFVGAELGCDSAVYWQVKFNSHLLFPAATWESPNPRSLKTAEGKASAFSEATAKQVWSTQKPVWIANLEAELPEAEKPRARGLGGIWFALKTDQQIFGVLELLASGVPEKSVELKLAIENLGVLIGKRLADSTGKKKKR